MIKSRWIWQLPVLIALIIGMVLIVVTQRSAPYKKDSGMVFGTVYNITYQSDRTLHEVITAALAEVDNALSPFNKASTITAINNGGSISNADSMFTHVFTTAMTISHETAGAFDITVAPLVNAWGFGTTEGISPTTAQVDSLRALTGYEKLRGDRLPKGMRLDCSSIAKGYACDIVAERLREHGVANYMIEIGGEIVVAGVSAKRLPWHIGIEQPTDDSTAQHTANSTILTITDVAMATSGNYRNFYYRDGKKYAHTIDPRTGYPVQRNILSATVIAPTCAVADGYATAFMVMGFDEAIATLERHEELAAYLIYTDEGGELSTWASPTIEDKITR